MQNSEGQGEGQGQTIKGLDNQVYVILLLVTFGFLILTTPAYLLFLVYMVVNYMGSPKAFAIYYTFGSFAEKLQFTNHGIFFFLYVISGKKFRTDLTKLFNIKFSKLAEVSKVSQIKTPN